jgi:hypothetical protein
MIDWKNELHNYLDNNNLLRITYLNDNVLEPAVQMFIDELKRFDRFKKASWHNTIEKNKGNNDVTVFNIYAPHTKFDSTNNVNLDPSFVAKIFIDNNKLYFEVFYNLTAKDILGDKLDFDIDNLIAKENNLTIEEVLKFKAEAKKSNNENEWLFEMTTKYWLMLNKIKFQKIATLNESFAVNHMADSDEISKRLCSLYKENCEVYTQLFESDKNYGR